MRVLLPLLLIGGVLASPPAAAQESVAGAEYGVAGAPQASPPPAPAAPGQPAPPPAPAPPRPPAAPPAPPAPPAPARVVSTLKATANIQIEVTIVDQVSTNVPIKKTVSFIAADGAFGRIRAAASARPNERSGAVPLELNVDAHPTLASGDVIHLELAIEYRPLSSMTSGEPSQIMPTGLNQSLTVLLRNGKPLVVSQAADPIADRKIVVEVVATILK